ncbi:MAG: tRNA (N(6)-L-threonylcarbamoyladenosine(37)-C(2))-methylthiotransferase MtaB [Pseudomonadota bacterium]
MKTITFGCRLNHAESHEMAQMGDKIGGLDHVIMVNRCAVTSEAERQLLQTLRKLRREQPQKYLVLTGCAATIDPDYYRQTALVDAIIPNANKIELKSFEDIKKSVSNHLSKDQNQITQSLIEGNASATIASGHETDFYDLNERGGTPRLVSGASKSKTRAYLQVQQGCDHDCTFCIIPKGRGKSISFECDKIVEKAIELTEQGYKEIVLTGVDLTSWQSSQDPKLGLGFLVFELLKRVKKLARLRLSSIDCIEIDPVLFELLIHEQRLMPHLHLSLQSGDDMILKRMKRRHLSATASKLCERLKQARQSFTFGCDLITGFPTESDQMFENTLRFVEKTHLTSLHVFPYSPRPNTPAHRIPNQVPVEIRRKRAKILRELGDKKLLQHLNNQIGKKTTILLETPIMGRAPDNSLVMLDQPLSKNMLVDVEIKGIDMSTGKSPKLQAVACI